MRTDIEAESAARSGRAPQGTRKLIPLSSMKRPRSAFMNTPAAMSAALKRLSCKRSLRPSEWDKTHDDATSWV